MWQYIGELLAALIGLSTLYVLYSGGKKYRETVLPESVTEPKVDSRIYMSSKQKRFMKELIETPSTTTLILIEYNDFKEMYQKYSAELNSSDLKSLYNLQTCVEELKVCKKAITDMIYSIEYCLKCENVTDEMRAELPKQLDLLKSVELLEIAS